MELKGKTALISGGSKGIGKAIAEELVAAGANLLLTASNADRLKKTQAEISSYGKVDSFVADLRQLKECEAVASWALNHATPLSILVNVAGATRGGDFLSLEDALWHDGFALKFYACVRLSRLLWQQLSSQQGAVVNIVGGFARTPDPDFMIGGAVNAAMANFSKALAGRGIRDGVRVNAIYPGTTETERLQTIFTDKAKASGATIEQVREEILKREGTRRIGKPEDVARLARFLVGPQAEHIQGVAISVDGGATKGLY